MSDDQNIHKNAIDTFLCRSLLRFMHREHCSWVQWSFKSSEVLLEFWLTVMQLALNVFVVTCKIVINSRSGPFFHWFLKLL